MEGIESKHMRVRTYGGEYWQGLTKMRIAAMRTVNVASSIVQIKEIITKHMTYDYTVIR